MASVRRPLQIGDRVVRQYDGAKLTVVWASKTGGRDQLIATEANLYSNPYDHASCYDLVSA
jgi:hypothetical protein